MAASYWESSQRQFWTFSKPKLAAMRSKVEESERNLAQQFALPERRLLNIYFMQRKCMLVVEIGSH